MHNTAVRSLIKALRTGEAMSSETTRRILVPIVGCEDAHYTLQYAVAFGESQGAILDILHVCAEESIPQGNAEAALGWQHARVSDLVRRLRPKTTVYVHVTTGVLHDEVRRFAISLRSDLVLLRRGELSGRLGSIGGGIHAALCSLPTSVLFLPAADSDLWYAQRMVKSRLGAPSSFPEARARDDAVSP